MAEDVLQPRQKPRNNTEQPTREEFEFAVACEKKASDSFKLGALIGVAITWPATQRLNYLPRISLSAAAGALYGSWRLGGSFYSSFNSGLSMSGSSVQKKFANVILQHFGNSPAAMQLMGRHFYAETVFNDSSSDQPQIRWRHRDHFDDSISHCQITHDSGSSGDSDNGKPDLGLKQVPVSPAIDMMADPLDCVLCYSGTEVSQGSETCSTSSKTGTQRYKRSRRRSRVHHRDVQSDPPPKQT